MNIPNRASDSGPTSRPDCPACGSRRWDVLSYCAVCEDTHCSKCATAVDGKLICISCLPSYAAATDETQVPAIEALHVIQARVQYANIPEWNTGKVN